MGRLRFERSRDFVYTVKNAVKSARCPFFGRPDIHTSQSDASLGSDLSTRVPVHWVHF